MKLILTESQYNKLLDTIIPNKKLTITESQYNRLIVESNSQDVFSEIKPGQAFKIKASGKDFKFEIIDSKNGQLLVKSLDDTTDIYFFIDYNGLINNNLITYKSKENAGPYSRIDGNLDKERLKSWSKYTIKNVSSFEVFETKLFNNSLFSINTEDGQKIKDEADDEGSMDINLNREFKDNLIKGMEINKSYLLKFYDDSTLKFFVTEKKGSILTINFKTKSNKKDMSYNDVDSKEFKNKEVWFREQDKLIGELKNELQKTTDVNTQKEIQTKLDKAIKDKDEYDLRYPRLQGLETISKSDYTSGVASKWVENIENSVEFKFGKVLKLDLDETKTHSSKIKIKNVEQDKKIADLKEKLANTTNDIEKKQIKQELKGIERINTLHFSNPEFDVYYPDDDISTFDLTLLLEYRPEDFVSKQSKASVEWTRNPTKGLKVKKFGLNGVKELTILGSPSIPVLGKKEPIKKTEINLEDLKGNLNNIYELTKNDAVLKDMILKRPSKIMQLLGLSKDKGIIPLEELQRDILNSKKSNTIYDKFVSDNNVRFEADFTTVNKTVGLEDEFEIFRGLLKNESTGIAQVKRYKLADNHIVLNMRRKGKGENVVIYSLFIGQNLEATDKYDVFSVQLKVSYRKTEAKLLVAKFNIKIDKQNGYKV